MDSKKVLDSCLKSQSLKTKEQANLVEKKKQHLHSKSSISSGWSRAPVVSSTQARKELKIGSIHFDYSSCSGMTKKEKKIEIQKKSESILKHAKQFYKKPPPAKLENSKST